MPKAVRKSTFSPDSTCFLISCSDSRDDKLVSAWNCETSEPFSVFSSRLVPPILQHPEEVYGVQFTADGMRIVTTCQDHVVRVWNSESERWSGSLCVIRIAPKTESKASH